MENRYHTYRDNLLSRGYPDRQRQRPGICSCMWEPAERLQQIQEFSATSRAPNPFHDYEVVMAQRWTVYTPKSMGGTDAEFITEVLPTSGIERTYLGYTNGITQHAYLEIEMPDDWDGGNVDFRFNWETTSASANTCIMQLWGLRTATGGTSDAALTQLASVTSTNAEPACGMSVHSLRILRYPAAGIIFP